jgi:hypothetical protein
MLRREIFRTPPWAVAALAGALAAGCAAPPPEAGDGDFPAEPYATITSDRGAFVMEVRTAPKQPPTRGSAAVELRITDAEGAPIDDLDLSAVPFMPDMGHAASNEPEIERLGEGRYGIAPVDMFMSGRWELITTVEGPVHDSAKVAFEIE